MAVRLEEISTRFEIGTLPGDEAEVHIWGGGSYSTRLPVIGSLYAEAFRGYGVDVMADDPRDVTALLRQSAIRLALASALDQWAKWHVLGAEASASESLIDIAKSLDPDPLRQRLRNSMKESNATRRKELIGLAASSKDEVLPPRTAWLPWSTPSLTRENGESILRR